MSWNVCFSSNRIPNPGIGIQAWVEHDLMKFVASAKTKTRFYIFLGKNSKNLTANSVRVTNFRF